MTKIQRYKDKVASLGCILCRHLGFGETPAVLHHPREGQGGGQRASDWTVLPLCHEHHVGKAGIHSGEFYQRFKMDEWDLAALVNEALHS